MVAIIDYGVGNLFSLNSSLKYIGADAVVTGDKNAIKTKRAIGINKRIGTGRQADYGNLPGNAAFV